MLCHKIAVSVQEMGHKLHHMMQEPQRILKDTCDESDWGHWNGHLWKTQSVIVVTVKVSPLLQMGKLSFGEISNSSTQPESTSYEVMESGSKLS